MIGKKYLSLGLCLIWNILPAEVKTDRQDFKPDEESRKRYWAQPIRFWGGKYITDLNQRFTLFSLSNARISFVFYISGKVDAKGRWPTAIGMAKPSQANWYINSFFSFNIDKITPRECHVEIIEVLGDGSYGAFILRYTHAKFQADLKLTLLDGDDKLLLEFAVKKINMKISDYMIQLLCYPSSLAGGAEPGRKFRRREALTPSQVLKEAKHTLTRKDYWILFYDNYFDIQKKRGEGPCALLFNPQKTVKSQCSITNYGCQTLLHYPVGETASVILWDFNGWSNQTAINFMKALKVEFYP